MLYLISLVLYLEIFKFQYDNTLSKELQPVFQRIKEFKFQYDNTLSFLAFIMLFLISVFKFQYDNTLRVLNIYEKIVEI